MEDSANVPPAWHDDPTDPTQMRYWDGENWTDQTSPKQGPKPPAGEEGRKSSGGCLKPALIFGLLAIVAIAVFGRTGGDSTEDAKQPSAEERPEPSVQDLPKKQAAGCPPYNPGILALVEAELDAGLVLRLATSDRNTDGTEWLVASIYRESDGARVSSADTWAVSAGLVLSISGSANQFSALPDGRDVLDGAFSDDVRQELEDCGVAAITGG